MEGGNNLLSLDPEKNPSDEESQKILYKLKRLGNWFKSTFHTEDTLEETGSVSEPTKSQIIDKIIDKGVAHYSSCACTDVYKGLSEDGFKQYMKLSFQEHDIPSDYEDMYLQYDKNVIEDECQKVHGRNIMFNNGSGSYTSVRFVCFRDDSKDFNLFVTSLQISCELGDKIFAYEDYVNENLLPLPNVDRDKIDNRQTPSILSKEEFERIFVFLADVTHRRMSTKLSIKAAPNN